MDLPNVIIQLERNPALVAWRPRGIFIAVTAGGIMIRVAREKPYRWIPIKADIIANDWSFGTIEQAQKAGEEMFGAAD
jgi:hypothetical protein